jgi:hypothetical protein
MKQYFIFLFFTLSLFSQNNSEKKPSEFRKIKTEFTKEYIENYKDEFGGNPWSIPFRGCSWYCGGMIDSIRSSTECNYFDKEKIITYNIHDFDYGTTWISSNEDNSKYIEYFFNKSSAKFTEIVIVNGNVKTDSLWNEYSRAKKVKMFINNIYFSTLNLEDIKDEQIFKFEKIGIKNNKKQWKVKFEIIESYNGIKSNIAISEIYYDGDGHENE